MRRADRLFRIVQFLRAGRLQTARGEENEPRASNQESANERNIVERPTFDRTKRPIHEV